MKNISNYNFFGLLLSTTVLTAFICFIFYTWKNSWGLAFAMVALTQTHFLLGYFFGIGTFQRWYKSKKLTFHLVIIVAAMIIFYLFVYQLLGLHATPLEKFMTVYLFGFLYFAIHNARDLVFFFKEYHENFGRIYYNSENVLYIITLYLFTAILTVKYFFGSSHADIWKTTDGDILFNGSNLFYGILYYVLIAVVIMLLMTLFFIAISEKKRSSIYLITATTIGLSGIFIIVIKYITGVDFINTVIIWHVMAWYIFYIQKINFFQKKFANQPIPDHLKKGISGVVFTLRSTGLHFILFCLFLNMLVILPGLLIANNQGLIKMLSSHPFYSVYWFTLYSVAHITYSWFGKE